jgi:2-methylfumaryl-CoA isomerase
VACGLYAAVGLLAAERRRLRTGEGSAITLALADVALAVAGHLGFLAEAQVSRTGRPALRTKYGPKLPVIMVRAGLSGQI